MTTVTLQLTEDEADIVLSALEDDRENYLESARASFAEGDKASGQAFGEAADRIKLVLEKVKALVGDLDR